MPSSFPLTRRIEPGADRYPGRGPHGPALRLASRRHPVPAQHGRCADAHLGCPCRGDATIHQDRAAEIIEARAKAGEQVECPECGGPATPLQIVTWGHCRPCHTADSRSIQPLRW